ncbi:uncharacterized protein [Clytia hemisphaerica]|uniref:Uncharacterized protein n=2 Tax=Clytia hemisphaerica TaxID=252671 RepID=A0A7M5XM41_9CNID
MSKAIIEKWPHLVNSHHNYGDAVNFFHRRLKTAFKNVRGKIHTPIPEIINKRVKFGKRRAVGDGESNVSKRTKLSWGVPNYLPPRIEGENDQSQMVHINTIQKESRKVSAQRDHQRSSFAMVQTFPDRRKMIVHEVNPIAIIIEQYPLLASKSEIFSEFSRLVGGWTIISRLETIKDVPILRITTTCEKNYLTNVRAMLAGCRTEESRLYVKNCLKLMLTSFLLRESTFSIFDQTKSYPRLVGTSASFDETDLSTALLESASFVVKIEDQIIAQANNFIEAFGIMTASYYVFNLPIRKNWNAL